LWTDEQRQNAMKNGDVLVRIEAFQRFDFAAVVEFVEAIQEHEREKVPELRPGQEIGKQYTEMLMRVVDDGNRCIIVARADTRTIGFACAWINGTAIRWFVTTHVSTGMFRTSLSIKTGAEKVSLHC